VRGSERPVKSRDRKKAEKIDMRSKFDFFRSNLLETLEDGLRFSVPIPF
jgi:hypothetical protein